MKKLFLLDGMALVYRAHFALIARPIFTSRGENTSALYGFTQTLLEIMRNQQPTHIAVAFDTDAPTQRHTEFADYKATRQAMPEDISQALPHVRRMLEAFRIPVLTCDGYEADDIIATIVRKAEKDSFTCYMVTPDKDFGQLVNEHVFVYKPSRMGDAVEIMGLPEIQKRWGIQKAEQVVDVLALMGDSSDNIPGVPGIGEKTASKLIGQFGSVENLLEHLPDLTGRARETLTANREQALLSKRLATLHFDAPCDLELEKLKLQPANDEALKALFVEFEFNSIGRRLFGEEFKAGRGFQEGGAGKSGMQTSPQDRRQEELVLEADMENGGASAASAEPRSLKRLADVAHDYKLVTTAKDRASLITSLKGGGGFAQRVLTSGPDPKQARILGLAFSTSEHTASFVPWPKEPEQAKALFEEFKEVLESTKLEKTGHNLKADMSVFKWQGINVSGKLFCTTVAHSLIEPDVRHSLDYVSEAVLGYTPVAVSEEEFLDLPIEKAAEIAMERADLALQLRKKLEPLLEQKGQRRVFYEIETPLIPVLVAMEHEGIKLDSEALGEFAQQLGKEIDENEKAICRMAGSTFNLNSPRQLGQVLFDVMKICAAPKKTKSGQYATDEQTLMALAPDHEVVQRLLEHRAATKLKTTYADALPLAIWPGTGRVHTTYNQVATSTGRLNSQDPNLQNIPIRSDKGQEIRKAFVPRGPDYLLMSADYSQIELRIIAALSREAGLLEAFRTGADVHTATAAKVYGVFPDLVTGEMRRKAKMVNYGIAYGISAFGLAQRLNIPRKEAAEIIDQYFKQFSGIRHYMDETIEFAREHGYVETVTGRRRYIRDIRSSNGTIRGGAERNAINAPIQGSAADMIKLAMIHIHAELEKNRLKSKMLLQVHDELVFDVFKAEQHQLKEIVETKMKNAIPLEVPIEVEVGVGTNWLEAH